MGFLSASGNIIEAVLTRKGREKLAQGNFNITKYAFSDDGVNYNLYDEDLGADADATILSLPVTQPSTNAAALKNLLVTMDPGTQLLTWLAINPTEAAIRPTLKKVSFYAKTMNKSGSPEKYIIHVNNETAWANNITTNQTIIGDQTNIEVSYKSNVNLSTDTVFTIILEGMETGIQSDEITLTAYAYTGQDQIIT